MKTLEKLDIGYPIIISSVGLSYWYLGINIETIDVAMIVGGNDVDLLEV